MRYQSKVFTLPTSSGKMTQTDYEIRVGLRHPDGRLVGTPRIAEVSVDTEEDAPEPDEDCECLSGAGFDCLERGVATPCMACRDWLAWADAIDKRLNTPNRTPHALTQGDGFGGEDDPD